MQCTTCKQCVLCNPTGICLACQGGFNTEMCEDNFNYITIPEKEGNLTESIKILGERIHAIEEGLQQKFGKKEHQDRNEIGEKTEPSSCDSIVNCTSG